MKKLLFLIFIVAIFLITGCSLEPKSSAPKDILEAARAKGKFTVGVVLDTKPFGFKDAENKPVGFDIDLAKRIAKELLDSEDAIEYVEIDSFDRILAVASGKVDFLIGTVTITPQRQMLVDFSEPYYTSGQAILAQPDSNIEKIKDLNNKKVIVKLNTTAEKTAKKYAPTAVLLGYKTGREAFEAFKTGAGDAIISDDTLLHGFMMDNPGYKHIKTKLSIEPYGIVMQNTPEAKSLKSQIDSIISRMKTDGSINKLRQKWHV